MIPLLDGSVPATGSAAMASQQEKRDVFGVRDTHASHTHNWLPRWDLVGRLGRRRPRYAQDPVPRGVSGGGRCCTAFVPSERETWSVQSQVRGVTASEIGHSARRRAVDGLPDRSQHTPYWDPRAFAPQLAAVNDIAPAARNAIGHCRLSCRTCHPPAPRDRLPGWTASWPYTGSVAHTATRPGRRTSGRRVLSRPRLVHGRAPRDRGIAGRNRVGFAGFLVPDYHVAGRPSSPATSTSSPDC